MSASRSDIHDFESTELQATRLLGSRLLSIELRMPYTQDILLFSPGQISRR